MKSLTASATGLIVLSGTLAFAQAASMIPHHQQAIEMSKQAKPKLQDAQVRQFADKTVRDQTAEIAELKRLMAAGKTAGK